jgi:P4 family phage/plasmid primase-like protien
MEEQTIKLNPNKIKKLKDKVEKFLKDRKVDGNVKYTHISMGDYFKGKYFIEKDDNREFLELYGEAVQYGVYFHIAEKQKDYAPIIIDIDLKKNFEDYEDGTRLYDESLILNVVTTFRQVIDNYLDLSPSEKLVALFEKPAPTITSTTVKDGFHLIFYNICAHFELRHLIRHHVVDILEKTELFSNFCNKTNDIIDKAVVSTNSWLMYGSKKPDGYLYKLTNIYNSKNNQTDISELLEDIPKLITMFSLQHKNWKEENANAFLEDIDEDIIKEEFDKTCSRSIVTNNTFTDIPESREDTCRKAKFFVSILSDERNDNYESWIRIGWALHNIDPSLLPIWIDFSKRSPKFKEGDCEMRWDKMRNEGLTIRSLMYWAEQDNYQKYHEFMKKEYDDILKKSLSGTTYSVGNALYTKYMDKYVCAKTSKPETWYEFKNHRWHCCEDGNSLFSKISVEFQKDYYLLINKYTKIICDESCVGSEKEELQNKVTLINKLILQLENVNYKERLMKECKVLFFDREFLEKLDENYDLIGFNNGIYDLNLNEFREGRPDDFISKTTKNNYINYNANDVYAKNMDKFLNEILPDPQVKEYLLLSLSTCVSGYNKEEKLMLCNGSGSNGKSLLFSLVQLALGDYYISCPITIVTRKRGGSNEASPELARLKGARCGCFQETDDGEKLNVGIMKEITGNDSFMVRNLYSAPIEVKPQIKFYLACNQLPSVPSVDGGTWRRLRVINFCSKFVEKPEKSNEYLIDNTLKQKIKDWTPTFASYLVYLYTSKYKKLAYLSEPDAVKYSTNSYKMENDKYTEFYNAKITKSENNKDCISTKAAFDEYKSWHQGSYSKPTPIGIQEFIKFMKDFMGDPNGAVPQNAKWRGFKYKIPDGDSSDDNK